MFCQYCGKQIEDGASFCPYCGKKLNEASAPAPEGEKDEFFKDVPPPVQPQQAASQQSYNAQSPAAAKTNTLAVVGFILSFFFALPGLICSIMGLKQCNQTGEGGKGLAIAGIVISAVSMFIGFIVGIIWGSAIFSWLLYY